MRASRLFVISLLALVACKGGEQQQEPQLRSATVAPSTNPNAVPIPDEGSAAAKKKDEKKGDKKDDDWIPAEHKSGAARWKDTGVYLDGKPIGFLTWGELPIGLKPTWVKDKVSANKRAGTKDLGWRWAQQRRYRFTDYLVAMGIDIKKVKELHVYGPRFSNSIVATTADLLSPKAREFYFRFGGNTSGKAIPQVPDDFAGGKVSDKIAAVMIYSEKVPPTLTAEGFELEGKPIESVPYYGEPIRGGIRVYLDNRLAAIIKRQELDPKKATTSPDGELHWSFAEFLKSKGVDASKVVEGWVIRRERREEKFAWADLEKMTFTASSQAKGGVNLGEQAIRASAIALHTRPITKDELPAILPEEVW